MSRVVPPSIGMHGGGKHGGPAPPLDGWAAIIIGMIENKITIAGSKRFFMSWSLNLSANIDNLVLK
jgi:hypothetical protein